MAGLFNIPWTQPPPSTKLNTFDAYYAPLQAKDVAEMQATGVRNRLALMNEVDLNDYRRAKVKAYNDAVVANQLQEGGVGVPTINAPPGGVPPSDMIPIPNTSPVTPPLTPIPGAVPGQPATVPLTNALSAPSPVTPTTPDVGYQPPPGATTPPSAATIPPSPATTPAYAPPMPTIVPSLIEAGAIPAVKPNGQPLTMGEIAFREEQINKELERIKTIGGIIKSLGGPHKAAALWPSLQKKYPQAGLPNIDWNSIKSLPDDGGYSVSIPKRNPNGTVMKDKDGNIVKSGYSLFHWQNDDGEDKSAIRKDTDIGTKSQSKEQLIDTMLHDPDPEKKRIAKETYDKMIADEIRVAGAKASEQTEAKFPDYAKLSPAQQSNIDRIVEDVHAGRIEPKWVETNLRVFGANLNAAFTERYQQKYGSYDQVKLQTNATWWKQPGTQQYVRRAKSAVMAMEEDIRLAKLVNNPDAMILNRLTGAAKKAFSNSQRHMLDMGNLFTSDELNQILGGRGGAVEYFNRLQKVVDTNMSVTAYVNVLREAQQYLAMRLYEYAEGTPGAKDIKPLLDKIESKKPFSVEPRKPGETVEQYIKRTGG